MSSSSSSSSSSASKGNNTRAAHDEETLLLPIVRSSSNSNRNNNYTHKAAINNDSDIRSLFSNTNKKWLLFTAIVASLLLLLPSSSSSSSSSNKSFASSTWESDPSNNSDNANQNNNGSASKYKQVQYFGFQIYTGGAPAFLDNNNDKGRNRIPNPECIEHTYGQIPLDADTPNNNIQCYVGHEDPMVDVRERLRIMKDAIETAYIENKNGNGNNDKEVLKIFAAPEFFFRGLSGAYDFSEDPKRLDKIFGFNHTTKNDTDDDDDDEMCSENSPVCAVLLGLQEMVQDKRFEDWLFLFGTIVATQKIKVDDHAATTSSHVHPDNYEYLYYNFAPVYKGFDPKKMNNSNKHHFALGKRFIVPKRYVSTSDFLTPTRDVNLVDRGSGWEELFGGAVAGASGAAGVGDNNVNNEQSTTTRTTTTTSPPTTTKTSDEEWVSEFGTVFNSEGKPALTITSQYSSATSAATDAVDNPRTYQHKRYDDDWFAAYKTQLYEKAGYVQVEYDWLVIDGITFSIEVCLDHQLRTALDTFHGDIVTGRTTRIPSSYTKDNNDYGIEYVPIPTHQAHIGLVSSAGMSPNAESLALSQNGILFLQDGLSNQTARRFVDQNLQQQCGAQQGLQFKGGTVAVQRRAQVSKTEVRFEYELLSSNININSDASSSCGTATASDTEEVACEHKIPVYEKKHHGDNVDDADDWETNIDGIFSTKVYQPHLVAYGPYDISRVQ
uniref:Uncharacterized protein n=1 Tax=Pseudo-nitzschia australis TaxID=44445 RepID=A0A7S4EMU4_9STRA|mmetsp:Transcript_19632/g.41335  ORF Transcript_19632/g.41335 Transcript_19632/m.41335 type:complete len:723 (+) Transcript_19632:158-2326(+)|eukprot:CAMPEP_0168194752 /NCGR_PEP_ID=MMETSP0139_2-20121125/19422_1 /TAXON_ID=44445 /ORGANISM="Pseudo-nitzschia australis, Strain 10249 10 AB" /LENGTH=722 /DNA_ID=CAMNT_0008118425 /DNA_START=99 /DNA_END=2267 /DNA_ORIENTATION=+